MAIICRILLLAWGSLAVYYSNLRWPGLRLVLAIAFLAFGIWAGWLSKWSRRYLAFAVVYALLLVWVGDHPPVS